MSGRSRRRVELEDLTPSLTNGNATGTLDRLSPKELEQLYEGDLALNVATESAPSLIRGRLAARPVADARDSAAPALLRRRDLDTPAKLVGLVWAAVDMECTFHYEVIYLTTSYAIFFLYTFSGVFCSFVIKSYPVTPLLNCCTWSLKRKYCYIYGHTYICCSHLDRFPPMCAFCII